MSVWPADATCVSKGELADKVRRMICEMVSRSPSNNMRKDYGSRPLICTRFLGGYGPAGWLIVLEGSPPRGVILSLENDTTCYPPAIFFMTLDKSRRVGDAQARLVRQFIASELLTGKHELKPASLESSIEGT